MNLGSNLRGGSFDDLLVGAASWLLLGGLLWLAALVVALLVEALSGGRWQPARWTLAPPAWRRALLGVLVPLLATCGLSPAHADAASQPAAGTALEGLQLPSRPSGSLGTDSVHVVRTGDSLWSIARAFAPHAEAPEVAFLVTRLHRDNLGVIGADPDVLRPGQRLALPADIDHGGHR